MQQSKQPVVIRSRPVRSAYTAVRLQPDEKLALLPISRRAGSPGNLSAAIRYLIAQAQQPQGVER